MGCIEILGGLDMTLNMKVDQYETENSLIAFCSNLSKCLHV